MNDFAQIKGQLFNSQGYAIHDGTGVRTAVFLSGCPLRCRWCQNPEARTREAKIFFKGTAGGVTLSGGEVLAQPDFSAAVLALCKEEQIHTAIETCGYGAWESFRRILAHTDLVLYDFKHMDSGAHRAGTSVPNELILENAQRVYHEACKPIAARVPVIPGVNGTKGNMEALARLILTRLGRDEKSICCRITVWENQKKTGWKAAQGGSLPNRRRKNI